VKVKEIVKTVFFTEILKGMALTLRTMFTHAVTRQYPEEKRPAMPGFRGLHAFVRDPDTGRERCIACGLCGAICPSQCITIYTAEGPEGRKVIDRYEIDVLRCVFCAFCVEACPVGAITLSEHFEYASDSREFFHMTKERLLENWDKYMAGPRGEEYFKRFWHPTTADYNPPEGQQALFRGAPAAEREKNAA
jgi:NADH-quinone oxidoreductase chain I